MDLKNVVDEFLKPPEYSWRSPNQPFACIRGTRRAMLDAERLFERAGRKLNRPIAPDQPEVRFLLGGGYQRFEWSHHAVLVHGESGSVYLDREKQTYIHRATYRPYVPEETAPKAAAESDEPIDGGRLLKIRFASPIDVEWEGVMRESKDLASWSDALVEAMFGDGADHLPGLVRKHLPQYTLIRMECWQVDRKGKRYRKLSEVALDDLRVEPARPEDFDIPKDYRDLRKRPAKSGQWFPFAAPVKPARKAAAAPPPPAQQSLATVAAPAFPFKPDFELPLPSCLPSTLRVSASFELHQILLDHIRHIGNILTTRLGGFEAHRAAGDTKVTLTVDWLAQLRTSHDNIGIADGFFCLLVNDDADHPGVLQRRALAEARSLVAGANTLPLGTSDEPLVLDAAATAEIQALLDARVPRADRFDQLGQDAQDAVRDAVLNRLGRFEQTFEGDSGELRWPDYNGDLLRYRSQLESVSLQLNFEEIIESLAIVDRRNGPTLIRLRARVPEFSLTYQINWSPGLNLGILIGAALVVTPVALPVAVIVLLGMGPVGWGILLAALAALPTLVPAAILAIDILAIMITGVTQAKIALANGTLLVEMEPGTDHTSAAVLRPTKVSFNGDITLSLDSEMPRSSQQIIEDVLAWAVNAFDLARDSVEKALKEFLGEALASVPHTRIPLGFTFGTFIPGDISGEPDLFEPVLEHELTAFADDGVANERIGYAVLAKSSFQPPEQGAYFTQVDPDLRPIWRGFADQLAETDSMLYGGYGLSQNLLNSWAQGQWLAQRLQSGIGAATLQNAADIIRGFCPDCLCTGNLEGHVWAASSPRLLVQHELFASSAEHPYLDAIFSDLRLCLSCSDDDPKGTLEIQFSAQTIAEVGFGSVADNTLTLLTADSQFGDIYYDANPDVFALLAGRLGVVTDGEAFKGISELSLTDQINFARAMSGVLEDAARRIFRQNPASLIGKVPSDPPDPPRRDRQLYDVIEGRIFARRSSLFVIFTPNGAIRGALPVPDGKPTIDLKTIRCPQAIGLLPAVDQSDG